MGVIYSARNRISSLKVFHFLLYPRSSIYFFRIFTFYIVFDVVWVRVYKYTKINSREITSLPERKSVAADQITRDCRNYLGGGGKGSPCKLLSKFWLSYHSQRVCHLNLYIKKFRTNESQILVPSVVGVISRNHPQLKTIHGGFNRRPCETGYDTYQGNINENIHYKK